MSRSLSIACFACALILAAAGHAQRPTPSLLIDLNRYPLRTQPSFPGDFVPWGRHEVLMTGDGAVGVVAVHVDTKVIRSVYRPGGCCPPWGLFAASGQTAYFWAGDLQSDSLWLTDRVSGTTQRIVDTNVMLRSHFYPPYFGFTGTHVLFAMETPTSGGPQLGSHDVRTGQTTLITIDANVQSGARPDTFFVLGGVAYFAASTVAHGRELWTTDGTQAGTRLFADLNPGAASSNIHEIGATPSGIVPSKILVSATPSGGTPTLWAIDAGYVRRLGSFRVARFYPHPNSAIRVMFSGEHLGASPTGFELFETDGQSGVNLVKDIRPGPGSSEPVPLGYLPNGLVMKADDGTGVGPDLWITDGTSSGTVMIWDFSGGILRGGSAVVHFNGVPEVIFTGNDIYGIGAEPWLTDGTPGGTRPLIDLNPQSSSRYPENYVDLGPGFGNQVVFAADDGIHEVEPWISDGSVAGTRLLADLDKAANGPGTRSSDPGATFRFGGTLRFDADDGLAGRELWSTNGSASGTSLDLEMRPGPLGSAPAELVAMGDRTFFTADDLNGNRKLWMRVRNGAPTVVTSQNHVFSDPTDLTVVNEVLYFVATNTANGTELWRSNGTPNLTFPVDIVPGSGSSEPQQLTAFKNRLYFQATDPSLGRELWVRWEGRGNTTQLVIDLLPGIDGAYPDQFTVLGDRLLFRATGPNGRELWSTDGTAAGTVNLVDLQGPGDGNPRWLQRAGDRVFFAAGDGIHGRELWVTDGTSAGTRMVLDIAPGRASARPAGMTALGDRVFFAADDGTSGQEPWISDGTAAGTFRLGDIYPGPTGSSPRHGYASGSRHLWFAAEDPYDGRRLWRTDGTVATTMKAQIVPGGDASDPLVLGAIGGTVVFAGDDPTLGREPFVVPAGATSVPHGVGCSGDARVPDISVEDPVLGAAFRVRVRNLRTGGFGMVAMGRKSPFPLRLGYGCWLYTDAVPALFGPYPVANGAVTWTGVIPNVPVLTGFELAFQGIGAPSTRTIGFDLSQGVLATIGN